MADSDKYVAYVGTYTNGSSLGIYIYDLEPETGYMVERGVVPVKNASYMTKSYNGKYLYSIEDEGVSVLEIQSDGGLLPINKVKIDGMRGCHLSTSKDGRFLYVAGYHDGKITVMHTHKDGRLGSIMDGVYHKGLGYGMADNRNFTPHVSCVTPTPDDKYVCAVDNGIDQVKIYTTNTNSGKLELIDILRCRLESGPRKMIFGNDGRFAYINCSMTNTVNVYSYDGTGKTPTFDLIQEVQCMRDEESRGSSCYGMRIAPSGKYLYATVPGENTVAVFSINQDNGTLNRLFTLPISGWFPKDIGVFPDEKTIAVLNHESNDIRFFTLDYKKGTMVMKGKPIAIESPNCIVITSY